MVAPHLRSPLGPGALQWKDSSGNPIPGWGEKPPHKRGSRRRVMSASARRREEGRSKGRDNVNSNSSKPNNKQRPQINTEPRHRDKAYYSRTDDFSRSDLSNKRQRPQSAHLTWNQRHSKQSSTQIQGLIGSGGVAPQTNTGYHIAEMPSRICQKPARPASAHVTSVRSRVQSQRAAPTLKMPPPPQHLAPHLKTEIKKVLFPYAMLNGRTWKSMQKSGMKEGIFDSDGKSIPPKTKAELDMEFPNRRKMVPGTMTHFVQAAIMAQVDIYADGHGDYNFERQAYS